MPKMPDNRNRNATTDLARIAADAGCDALQVRFTAALGRADRYGLTLRIQAEYYRKDAPPVVIPLGDHHESHLGSVDARAIVQRFLVDGAGR